MAKTDLKLDDDMDGAVWLYDAMSANQRASRQLHRHHEPEFNLVTRGTAAYLIDGLRYDIRTHSLLWLLPEQNHILIDESPDFSMWIAVFRPAMLKRWVRRGGPKALLDDRVEGIPCQMLANSVAMALGQLTASAADLKDEPVMFNAALPLLALTAWQMHELSIEPQFGEDVHPAVERAATIIRQNPSDIDLQELAYMSGLSLSRLSRLFKQQVGMALVTFRQQQRLRYFKHIYAQGRRYNMTQAALMAGFGSYPQFHRVFKQFHYVSPQVYYQKHKREPTEID